jgi:hypothetical protein
VRTESARRVLALVKGLPADAAFLREETKWTRDDEFAALTIETIAQWGRSNFLLGWHQFMLAHRSATGKLPPTMLRELLADPERLDHPSRPAPPEPPKPKLETDPAAIQRWFAQHR